VVGADNVVAGTDCGFSSVAGFTPVHAELVWAKLGSLVEGARIATRRLFG
jgi:5-methyltetrahydropteroyltriglutamate--homocysteine methyltransferase